jgi:hypothetical protein
LGTESTGSSRLSNGVNSENTNAIGDYIISPSSSRNVLVVGDYTQVPENVDGFVQLNGVYIPKVANGTAIKLINSAYTCIEIDSTILVDASLSSFAINLPTTSLTETVTYTVNGVLTTVTYGKKLSFKRTDGAGFVVTLTPPSGTLINGATSYSLPTGVLLTIQNFNTTNWIII